MLLLFISDMYAISLGMECLRYIPNPSPYLGLCFPA